MRSQSAIRSPNLLAVAVSSCTRALALFGPASVTLRTSVVSVRNIPSPCKVHLRNTEAGRMHSLNVAGIMILLAIIALFVLAWLVV